MFYMQIYRITIYFTQMFMTFLRIAFSFLEAKCSKAPTVMEVKTNDLPSVSLYYNEVSKCHICLLGKKI